MAPVQGSQGLAVDFLRDAIGGLSANPKRLPPRYFYDDVGSALFEAITALPEYGLTRADERLLRQHAGEIARIAGGRAQVVELGSGTGRKTRWILEALGKPAYHAIDVSAAALEHCRRDLAAYARLLLHQASYLDGLRTAAGLRTCDPLLLLFLGSTIGNFEPDEAAAFLTDVRSLLRPGDLFLIGFDLVKDREVFIAAYDDPVGVTAAFNLNVLARLNRELGANFDLESFSHEARYDESARRVEMHLRSATAQTVTIPGAGDAFRFAAGETIWTESSHKYTAAELDQLARTSGFNECRQWVDAEWPFAESLWIAV